MIDLILSLLSPFWPYIAGALGILGALFLGRRQGRVNERDRQAAKDAKADLQAHERINNAETGSGMSDAERVDRLRDFAAKHGARPPKAGGR